MSQTMGVEAVSDWVRAQMVRDRFPQTHAVVHEQLLKGMLNREEKRFLKNRKMDVMILAHALGLAHLFGQLPQAPKSETDKVAASIRRAMDHDPAFFNRHAKKSLVQDALEFLNQHPA